MEIKLFREYISPNVEAWRTWRIIINGHAKNTEDDAAVSTIIALLEAGLRGSHYNLCILYVDIYNNKKEEIKDIRWGYKDELSASAPAFLFTQTIADFLEREGRRIGAEIKILGPDTKGLNVEKTENMVETNG